MKNQWLEFVLRRKGYITNNRLYYVRILLISYDTYDNMITSDNLWYDKYMIISYHMIIYDNMLKEHRKLYREHN